MEQLKKVLYDFLKASFPEFEVKTSGDFDVLKKDRIYFQLFFVPQFNVNMGEVEVNVYVSSLNPGDLEEKAGNVASVLTNKSFSLKNDSVFLSKLEFVEMSDVEQYMTERGSVVFYQISMRFRGKYMINGGV